MHIPHCNENFSGVPSYLVYFPHCDENLDGAASKFGPFNQNYGNFGGAFMQDNLQRLVCGHPP